MGNLVGLLCHQLPERSPACDGLAFPLCYRCAGLYLGVFAAYLWLLITSTRWRRRLPDTRTGIAVSLLMLPLWLDGWANALDVWSTPGWLRALTGVGVGVALPLLLLPLVQPLVRPLSPSDPRELAPTVRNPVGFFGPICLALFLIGLIYWPPGVLAFQGLAVAATAGAAALWMNLVWAAVELVRDFRRSDTKAVACRYPPARTEQPA